MNNMNQFSEVYGGYTLTTADEVAQELKELRGATVSIFGQPQELPEEPAPLLVDALDVIEGMREWSVDDPEELDEIAGLLAGDIEQTEAGNSYNWSGYITNDIDFKTFPDPFSLYEFITLVRFHRFGDVRGNYTEFMAVRHDGSAVEFLAYSVDDYARAYCDIEVDGVTYGVTTDIFSECAYVYDFETGDDLEISGAYDLDDLRELIREEVNE